MSLLEIYKKQTTKTEDLTMGLQQQFVKFHDTIKLTKSDEAYKKVRERDENILKDIREAMK